MAEVPGLIAGIRRVTDWTWRHPLAVVVVATRLLLVVTYPLNFLLADGRDYYAMLLEGRSSLIHAPGYPFLLGLPWRNPVGALLIEHHPLLFQRLLLVTQHGVNLVCLALGYRVVRDLFGRLPAGLFVLAYGLHYQVLTLTSSATPEWLQGSLLMVVAFLVLRAAQTELPRQKYLLWGLCGLVAAWMYLVKFNSLALLPLPAAAAAWELVRSRRAWRWLAVGAATAAITYASFLLAVHRPSTGTWSITLDHAWVLLERMVFFSPGQTLHPEAGIQTRRILALNSVLPWPENLRAIAHVDWVAAAEREPYRRRYGHLLTANDATLAPMLEDIEVPRPYDLKRAFLPVATCLGLPESNHLGVAVFFEHVREFPTEYLRSVWRLTWRAMTRPKQPWMYPVDLNLPRGTRLGWGFVELAVPASRKTPWRFDRPVVWWPGVRFFSLHFQLLQVPPLWFTLVIAFGTAVAAGRWFRHRWHDHAAVAYLVTVATVAGFILASNLTYHFRWKEVGAIMPLLAALLSVALAWLVRWLANRCGLCDENPTEEASNGSASSTGP